MKKKIIAFYDVLLFALICGPLLVSSILVLVFGQLGNMDWILKHWYWVVLFAIGIAVPVSGTLLIRFVIINEDSVHFHYFPFTKDWQKAMNNIDVKWNQDVHISEVSNVEIVKLTQEEKQTKVFYKHWFNKYLKINLSSGNLKYAYVGNYANFQIEKIIKLLSQE